MLGPSGAGKSTLCRLMVGLAIPNVGEIRLDGSPIHHWDPEQFGRHIGYLPQDVELFTGSVRDNIARMQAVDDEAVVKAAMLARAHEMIQHFPQGYDTWIGDGGVRLSGGQRQRVGLARAVFGSPRFIVLDEPNANLDQAGEVALSEAISELKQVGVTLVIVGHRPSTLSAVDKILLLKEGRVAMFGQREEVLNALQVRSADLLPETRKRKQTARRSPQLISAGNGSDHNGKLMVGVS
jgi:ABC-type protease/lipase transport system fused ATPase/permease subunit